MSEEVLFSKNKFSKEAALKAAWSGYSQNFGFICLLILIWLGAIFVPLFFFGNQLIALKKPKDPTQISRLLPILYAYTGFVLIWFLITYPGLYKIALKINDGLQLKLSDLFCKVSVSFKFLLGITLVGLIVFFGLILLIVPGIYLSLRFYPLIYLIVDRELSPIAALKESWRLTENSVLNIFLLFLLLFVIGIAIALVIGIPLGVLFAVTPLKIFIQTTEGALIFQVVEAFLRGFISIFTLLVSAYVYRQLSPSESLQVNN